MAGGVITTRPWSIKPPLAVPVRRDHFGVKPSAVWTFREAAGATVFDPAGRQPLTLINGPIWSATVAGSGVTFNGTDQYGTAANSDQLTVGTGDFALHARLSVLTLPNSFAQRTFFSNYGSSTANTFVAAVRNADGGIHFYGVIRDASSNVVAPKAFMTIELGRVYDVWTIRRGTTGEIWVDGRLAATETNASLGNVVNSDGDLPTVGMLGVSGGVQHFHGIIAHMAAYKAAPSAEQVRSLYANPYAIYQPRRLFLPGAAIEPTAITGTVTLNSVPVEGATVRAINQNANTATDTTTNGSGEFSIETQAGGTYHVMVEYEDDGTFYRAVSRFDQAPDAVVAFELVEFVPPAPDEVNFAAGVAPEPTDAIPSSIFQSRIFHSPVFGRA